MGGIPVFLWHYFADSLSSNAGSLTETYSRFESFLAFLKEQGFKSVFPEESRVPGLGGGKQVILTFDDGRKDQIRAAQLLDKYGFKGIFFIVPDRTSSRSDVYLTREEVGRIAKAGHRIAVHGYEHRSLASSGSESGSATQKAFDLLTDSGGLRPSQVEFAMPFGHYTDDVIDNLVSRYRYLMSVNPGYWDGASVMMPRMLIFRDTSLEYYKEYVQGGANYAPALVPITADGAVTDTVAFRIEASRLPDKIELLAVSADSSGRPYSTHPLGDAARVRGTTLVLDLKKMRDRYFGPARNVIGYALVYHGASGLRYLTPGVMHWLSDPATGPLLRP
jgi:peptidoglycan/xylan/chitin deacetylase (PgdA/CDA1 family)